MSNKKIGNEREFKGVWIPKDLWLNPDLKPMDKFFLLEIDSFAKNGSCFASNKHFADLFHISASRASQIIISLTDRGFLNSRLIYKDKKCVKRVLSLLKGGIKKTKGGYQENCEGTNTNITNTNITNKTNTQNPRFGELKTQLLETPIENWKELLNVKTNELFNSLGGFSNSTWEQVICGGFDNKKKYSEIIKTKESLEQLSLQEGSEVSLTARDFNRVHLLLFKHNVTLKEMLDEEWYLDFGYSYSQAI